MQKKRIKLYEQDHIFSEIMYQQVFMLIERLVVIAVIANLEGMQLPALSNAR